MDERVDRIRPTNMTRDRSLRVPAPKRVVPMKRIEATGRMLVIDVLSDRMSVWLTARFTESAKV